MSGPEIQQPQVAALPQNSGRLSPRAVHVLAVWLRDLVIAVLIAAFFVIFLYQPVKVEGTSMMPLLDDEEHIFVNKFVYSLEPVGRGDVVVFRYPGDPSTSLIKRVVGIPGDRIRIDEGRVFVNGKMLVEDYVAAEYADFRSYPEITVPVGSYFLLGDHRNMSKDSRYFGPIEARFIYGKAVFGYWPVQKLGRVK